MKKKIALILAALLVLSVACYFIFRQPKSQEKLFVPGLYQTGALELYAQGNTEDISDMLIMSWEDLIKNEIIYLKASRAYTMVEIVEGQYSNPSADALAGDLILPSDGSVGYLGYADLAGRTAFAGCDKLTGVYIPANILEMSDDTFRNCSALTTVVFQEGCKLQQLPKSCFRGCENLVTFAIPDSITVIGSSAFMDCKNLQSFSYGEDTKLETIRTEAFSGCVSLSSVELPATLKRTDSYIFPGCSDLETVIFHSALYIDDDLFGTKTITSITFDCNPPIFTSNAFQGMTLTVYYPADNPSWIPEMCLTYGGATTWLPIGG